MWMMLWFQLRLSGFDVFVNMRSHLRNKWIEAGGAIWSLEDFFPVALHPEKQIAERSTAFETLSS